jgi:glycosyltransferase involved in cell wall biosynthesis
MVSIIIPTFQSCKTLETCLKSVVRQTYKNVEIIVVDAYSTDDTIKVAEKFDARIFLLAAERSHARNFGAKKAGGEIVFFIDSDMELSPNIVEECVSLLVQKNLDAVIVPEESVGDSFLARCKRLEKTMHMQEEHAVAPRFFKKDVFEHLGGYDEQLVIGEDFELTKRFRSAGFRMSMCNATIKHHEEFQSMRRLVTKLYYYGKKLPLYLKKEPYLTLKTSSPIHFFKNLRLLKKHPIHFAGLCTLKVVEYAAYSAGILANILSAQ